MPINDPEVTISKERGGEIAFSPVFKLKLMRVDFASLHLTFFLNAAFENSSFRVNVRSTYKCVRNAHARSVHA